jgi:uncharacterized membrane protein YjjP (DUF1212 family)
VSTVVASTGSEPAVQFIVELAAALNEAGESVTLNQRRMDRIAAAYGVSDARVAVMPNMVLAAGGHGAASLARGAATKDPIQRLDRTGAVADLAETAERGAVAPDEGLQRLDEIAAMPHRFGVAGVILGHMVLTVGLALILQPTPEALGTAAAFGAFVGALKLYARHTQTIAVLLPVTAATLVSALASGSPPTAPLRARCVY